MIEFHYAVQSCDIASNVVHERYAGKNKTEVSKKCLTSFLNSVRYLADKKSDTHHTVMIFDDHSTNELLDYLEVLKKEYSQDNLAITINNLNTYGIMQSIRSCYEWLDLQGKDIVFQVQDDYLFHERGIYEMADVWFQLFAETDTHAIVSPYNNVKHWLGSYRNKSTPRAVIVGGSRYWIQYYDMSCSFMTSRIEFVKHWELYDEFLKLPSTGVDGNLESISLNYILTKKGVLGLTPVDSLALHIQHETDKDPYINWKQWWDSVKIIE